MRLLLVEAADGPEADSASDLDEVEAPTFELGGISAAFTSMSGGEMGGVAEVDKLLLLALLFK